MTRGRPFGLSPIALLGVLVAFGIASALAAGMKVVGVAHTYPAERLRAAHRVVVSLAGVGAGGLHGLFPS